MSRQHCGGERSLATEKDNLNGNNVIINFFTHVKVFPRGSYHTYRNIQPDSNNHYAISEYTCLD